MNEPGQSRPRLILVGHTRRDGSPWVLFSTVGLGALLGYMLARAAIEPGFTDYWGYTVFQIGGTLILIIALTAWFAPQGGLSWYTHLVVTVNTWADTFGTAGHLYQRYDTYDKVTHFLAGVALTAAAADILRALNARGALRLALGSRLIMAMTLTLVVNIGWELYEYLGDVVFQSQRHRGAVDTAYDFVSDIAGALVFALAVWLRRPARVTAGTAPLRAAEPLEARAPASEEYPASTAA